jgi:hypothetical protein
MPTVLCYVLCLTFVGGFDSHTLPPVWFSVYYLSRLTSGREG